MSFRRKKKSPPPTPPPKKRPPEGLGICKYCLVKNGHAGWCPTIS